MATKKKNNIMDESKAQENINSAEMTDDDLDHVNGGSLKVNSEEQLQKNIRHINTQ